MLPAKKATLSFYIFCLGGVFCFGIVYGDYNSLPTSKDGIEAVEMKKDFDIVSKSVDGTHMKAGKFRVYDRLAQMKGIVIEGIIEKGDYEQFIQAVG